MEQGSLQRFHPQGQVMIVGVFDGTVQFFDVVDHCCPRVFAFVVVVEQGTHEFGGWFTDEKLFDGGRGTGGGGGENGSGRSDGGRQGQGGEMKKKEKEEMRHWGGGRHVHGCCSFGGRTTGWWFAF